MDPTLVCGDHFLHQSCVLLEEVQIGTADGLPVVLLFLGQDPRHELGTELGHLQIFLEQMVHTGS